MSSIFDQSVLSFFLFPFILLIMAENIAKAPQVNTEPTAPSSGSASSTQLIGIIIGCLLAVVLSAIFLYFCFRMGRANQPKYDDEASDVLEKGAIASDSASETTLEMNQTDARITVLSFDSYAGDAVSPIARARDLEALPGEHPMTVKEQVKIVLAGDMTDSSIPDQTANTLKSTLPLGSFENKTPDHNV